MSKKHLSGILEGSFAVFTAFNMAIYGSAKYVQFGDISQYAYSQSFSVILSIFEILGFFVV